MKLFSQRRGLTPVKEALQAEAMDEPLRNGIWNVLSDCFWDHLSRMVNSYDPHDHTFPDDSKEASFIYGIWADYFKVPTDTVPRDWKKAYAHLRRHFFESPWFTVYDFIEFTVSSVVNRGHHRVQHYAAGCC